MKETPIYKTIIKIGQRILRGGTDGFNFELLLGLIEAYHLGASMNHTQPPDSKWFFYTVTVSGKVQNGVLMSASGHFNIRFLMNVYKKKEVVINWWSEINRQQALEYIGAAELERLENEVNGGPPPPKPPKVSLVRD